MGESYNYKLVKSGNHVEIYEYKDKEVKRGFKRRPRCLWPGDKMTKKDTQKIKDFLGSYDFFDYKTNEGKYLVNEEEVTLLNYQEIAKEEERNKKRKAMSSMARTRNNIRRLINANTDMTTFLTLTFADNITELKKANRLFNLFTNRTKTHFPDFKYLAVIEFQKRGAVHYHILCNFDLPEFKEKKERFAFERIFARDYWKHGFIKLEEVDHVDNLGAYVCKYLGKDMFDERMFGKKKFFCSQNLNRPEEMINNEAREFFSAHCANKKPTFVKPIDTKWMGLINYECYKIDPIPETEVEDKEPEKVDALTIPF